MCCPLQPDLLHQPRVEPDLWSRQQSSCEHELAARSSALKIFSAENMVVKTTDVLLSAAQRGRRRPNHLEQKAMSATAAVVNAYHTPRQAARPKPTDCSASAGAPAVQNNPRLPAQRPHGLRRAALDESRLHDPIRTQAYRGVTPPSRAL